MNFTTYAELQSAISQELNRTDLDDSVPAFIRLTESQTERQLRVREMLTSTALTVSGPTPVPADFLEARKLILNTTPIQEVDFNTLDGFFTFKAANSQVGSPSVYTVVGDNFEFAPTPDSSYVVTLLYYAQIPRLSDAVTSNWLLERHPDIYFYGALLNSAPYLKEDARVQVWAALFQKAVEALQIADDRAKTQSNNLVATARTF